MLARRVITLPATTIRRLGGSQLQRRFIHPSRCQLQALLPRPNTWLAKIRFRADGKPRSKRIAFGFGSLILLNLLTVLTLMGVIEEGNKTQRNLLKLIYLQHTDVSYDSVNFDDPISNLSYFTQLYMSITASFDDEHQNRLFNDVMAGIIKRANARSEASAAEVQHIMRTAAERIHNHVRALTRDSIVMTADLVAAVMETALTELFDDCDDEDENALFHIRDHTKKDAVVSKEYEVLG